jgi:hypothetical protein
MANDEKVKVASAAFIVLSGILKKEKNDCRCWITRIFLNRNRYSGSDLLCGLSIENTR